MPFLPLLFRKHCFRSRFVSFVAEFKNRISFIAPSDACKKWFLKQYKEYEDKIIVVYHQTLEGSTKFQKELTIE